MRFVIAIIVAAVATMAIPTWAGAIEFGGDVSRGETFVRKLPGDLVFKLVPDRNGWTIWVGDPANPSESYSSVVTPPYHGINALTLTGFHFRNADNTGPNEPGPKNVNAPGRIRHFRTVLNRADYRTVRDALDVLLWPAKRKPNEISKAQAAVDGVRKGDGVLRVLALDLGNLKAGERPWIDRMTFNVSLDVGR